MTFTTDIPTTPGFYAWRLHKDSVVIATNFDSTMISLIPAWPNSAKGEWCRLVPHDEVVPKEEVGKAWEEGVACLAANLGPTPPNPPVRFESSRAKRVMEGKE